ncbi:uncharacterized protein LAESUDRAFT_809876 [Laetiporus sulphureus 93-53]|uniref:Amidohydrolase-related domain-containing protein n=1 Tax=Laetiporus sulphureus 93-53 TaxID=1314785 RepID=A0A165GZL7_9APHY|nr:uncharacterized protein LAESUDRAFT_809876 [Laetiporus sulphureus 93-53]KZT11046.1 hypothetical protein LAESUDRAFT_809876 [Laetiporus sulphureus 93-53]
MAVRNVPSSRGSRVVCAIFALGLLAVSAIASIAFSHASLSSIRQGRGTRVPLRAANILQHCRALVRKPGPPETFHGRVYSDRFQPGTRPVHLRNASLWTGRAQGLEVIRGDLFLANGIIKAVEEVSQELLDANNGNVLTFDLNGAWITPGIIDVHSHLAVESAPSLRGSSDGNSWQGLVLPWLRSLDALNTHDEGFMHSIAGGVTTSLILPGSADAIGGQGFVIKLRPTDERSPSSMLLEPPFSLNGSDIDLDLPPRWRHMKHACGENPARVYSGTRMDTTWAYREAYNKARDIMTAQDEYCAKALAGDWDALSGQSFPNNLQWEALVDVLRGKVKVQTHCYEAVDFDDFVRLSNEFQFPVAAFHHAHEAYLVLDLLKQAYEHTPAIAMFATFARYKREAFRHSEFAPRILADAGVPVIMKSDHPAILSRYLVNEAAQAHYYGLPENVALASVISTPATVLGLDHRIGYLKEGYDADVVIWDSHPLSLGATPNQVIIDGIPQFEHPYTAKKPASHQHAPTTPSFDDEASQTLRFDGLPPLAPPVSTNGTVVFTNVSSMWIRGFLGQGVVQTHASDGDAEHVVVAHAGRVVCSGTGDACLSFMVHSDAVMINLHRGALQPGLTTYGSSLGLQEVAMEVSTTDGAGYDPLEADVPSIAGGEYYVPRAVDGLQYGSRDALLAYRHGVTLGITPPMHSSLFGGLSTAFSLGSPHKLDKGAVVQDVTALHVSLARGGTSSVSTQVAALRRMLLEPIGERGAWLGKVRNGWIPLVIDVDSADVIATLIDLKHEVELVTGVRMKMTISGGTEAHLLAEELAGADIGVILKPPRSYPYDWDRKRILAGPPLTQEGPVAHLMKHGVKVGLGPHGISGDYAMSAWAVRNLRFDAAWAYLESPHILTKTSAFALASSNVEELLGLQVIPGQEDLVATSYSDVLGFEGKVVAVISPRRGVIDLFE